MELCVTGPAATRVCVCSTLMSWTVRSSGFRLNHLRRRGPPPCPVKSITIPGAHGGRRNERKGVAPLLPLLNRPAPPPAAARSPEAPDGCAFDDGDGIPVLLEARQLGRARFSEPLFSEPDAPARQPAAPPRASGSRPPTATRSIGVRATTPVAAQRHGHLAAARPSNVHEGGMRDGSAPTSPASWEQAEAAGEGVDGSKTSSMSP